MIRALQRGEAERSELQLWQRVLDRSARARARPAATSPRPGRWLQVRLFVLPAGTDAEAALPPGTPGLEMLARTLQIDGAPHLLVAGAPEALQALAQRVTTLKGSAHEVPGWLQADAGAQPAARDAAPG